MKNDKKILEKGKHGSDELTFEKLSYSQQAKTLNAQILGIKKGLKAHIKKGISEKKQITNSKNKYIQQLTKIINDLN